MNDDYYYDIEKTLDGLNKYISYGDNSADFDFEKFKDWVNQNAQPYTQYRYGGHMWGVNPHIVSVDISAIENYTFVKKLIHDIDGRNDNVIRGNRIFGPAYVTGEFMNFTERFSIEDGYVDVVITNMMIPESKDKANNIVGVIDCLIYYKGKLIEVSDELNNDLTEAVQNYILRHAIYTK